jgi:hypothetical protein
MNPYLQAFTAYHAHGEQEVTWTEAMDFHLQCGAIIATPEIFVMARPVHDFPENHPDFAYTAAHSDCWHIYAAAGDLRQLLSLARWHGIRQVTYQRRGRERIHCLKITPAPAPSQSRDQMALAEMRHTLLNGREIIAFLLKRAKELKAQLESLGHYHPEDFLKIPMKTPPPQI